MVPDNKNFLSPLGYKFILVRAPNLDYNVQSVRIPGLQVGSIPVATPFVANKQYGKAEYNALTVTFRVSEDMNDYLEIHDWLVGLSAPSTFDQHKDMPNKFSDITVYIMNSASRPNIEVKFFEAFPVVIGDLEFNTTDTDVNYIECTCEFEFLRYEITKK